ncbi:hypothetical protein [Chryseobacterium sp.]|uniref:hypothetical protein n=1 Tax=Chryseobacterium sp. TaxID=1871047 RepID=UPI0024E27488|nr:hypothetical protein [Chryseobacterium sp.]
MTIDCRTEEGITIGLIDALISISRVLVKRDLNATKQIKEALKDLINDEDLSAILNKAKLV